MEWIKVMCNILDHRKIKMIRGRPDGDTLVLLWLLMLTEAGKCNRGGYLMVSDDYPYTEEILNTITGISLPTVRLGLDAFAQLGMIDRKDGAIFIKNWGKYQSEDKLEARREKERLRQQRHRAKEREKINALPPPDPVSRDSETLLSRDVTLENRQDKSREEKTTTEKARLLLSGTSLGKISDRELEGLVKRHGPERLLQVADVAAEMWRRDHVDRHNPGGYLHSLCCSLVPPGWYVPIEERLRRSQEACQRQKEREDEVSVHSRNEEQKNIAMDALWVSFSDEKREVYLKKASDDMPKVIRPSLEVTTVMAKLFAWEDQTCSHECGAHQ